MGRTNYNFIILLLSDWMLFHFQVIQGLDLALALMDTEEECELYVASRFAFGDIGNGSVIPPNSNLTYKITLWEARIENDLETKTISSRKIIG